MTMPGPDDALLQVVASQVSQVLTKTGEHGEKLAAISEQLRDLPSLQSRMREVELKQAEDKGGRDMTARVVGIVAVLAAIGAAVAPYFHR